MHICMLIPYLVLVVEFESEQYTGSESSGFVEVVVVLNGSSTTPISVMMNTSEQTATGENILMTDNLSTSWQLLLSYRIRCRLWL